MIYVFLAEGFEEIEALTPVDVLRRADAAIKTVGVTEAPICGAHGICIQPDITMADFTLQDAEMLILPGGMPGTSNLEQCQALTRAVTQAAQAGRYVAAICAAPSILGHLGLLEGRRATCFPSFENQLSGAIVTDAPVEIDGNIITSRGAGTAADFAFVLAGLICGENVAEEIRTSMQYR